MRKHSRIKINSVHPYRLALAGGWGDHNFVNFLADGYVVAWFQGKSEFGPRALGNRSILADPRSNAIRNLLSEKIKIRDSFMPYAPSVLFDHAHEYFQTNDIYLINYLYFCNFILFL